MANIQLAENLRHLRKLNNHKQEDIAEIFNISRQAISNYENKNREPDLVTLVRFASYYELNLDQLVLHNLANPSSTAAEDGPHNLAIQKSKEDSIFLTDEEVELIMNFRALSDTERAMVNSFTRPKK